jgi:hypothetical protein
MSQQSGIGVAFTGSGSAVPDVSLDNEGLSQLVETSDEWIATRTGIRSRRLSGVDGSLRAIATQAAQNALDMAGTRPDYSCHLHLRRSVWQRQPNSGRSGCDSSRWV